MVRRRTLTIDVTDEIQTIYDAIEKDMIKRKGKEYWKTLDKSVIQTFIFNKIEAWHYDVDKSEMREIAFQYVIRIDELSNK